jgi:hypothetical protein
LDRRRRRALEDAIGIHRRLSEQIWKIDTVRHQAAVRLRLLTFSYLGFDGQEHADAELIVLDAVADQFDWGRANRERRMVELLLPRDASLGILQR